MCIKLVLLHFVFCRYHAEKAKNLEFNFQRELEAYCKQDVEILTKACMKFRKLVMDEHNVDPFVASTTIASLCMCVSYSHLRFAIEYY